MKWILLVYTLILISLLLASRVSSDALQDCEDEIEELKEDAEDQIDNINTMRSSESKTSRELHAIKTAIVEVLHQKLSFWSPYFATRAVFKFMGTIDLDEWDQLFQDAVDDHKVAAKYLDTCSIRMLKKAHMAHRKWQKKIANMQWHPYRTIVQPNGNAERLVNMDDPLLVECREELGDEVCSLVVKALEEMEDYNPRRGHPVGAPWDYVDRKPVEYAEVMLELGSVMQRADDALHQLRSGFNTHAERLHQLMVQRVRRGRLLHPEEEEEHIPSAHLH